MHRVCVIHSLGRMEYKKENRLKLIAMSPHPLRGRHSNYGVDLLVNGSTVCTLAGRLESEDWLDSTCYGLIKREVRLIGLGRSDIVHWSVLAQPLKAQVFAIRRTRLRGTLFDWRVSR